MVVQSLGVKFQLNKTKLKTKLNSVLGSQKFLSDSDGEVGESQLYHNTYQSPVGDCATLDLRRRAAFYNRFLKIRYC